MKGYHNYVQRPREQMVFGLLNVRMRYAKLYRAPQFPAVHTNKKGIAVPGR